MMTTLIPTGGRLHTLPSTLESYIAQNSDCLRVVVVDNSLMQKFHSWPKFERRSKVLVVTLKSFLETQSIARVDFLHMDVQGAELLAFKGAGELLDRISMIQGSNVAPETIAKVTEEAAKFKKVMVLLDSNHTFEHVLAELEASASLTSLGSYCVVFDKVIERLPSSTFQNRPWAPGNNAKTAVAEFLRNRSDFVFDEAIEKKLLLTVAPGGFLKRVSVVNPGR